MRILYRKGNREQAWGISFDYAEFDDAQVDAALAAGWVRNPLELQKQELEHEHESDPEPEVEHDADADSLQQQDPSSELESEEIGTKEPEQESGKSQESQESQDQVADTDGNGKLSANEAKAYLDSIGVSCDGMHWKAVVKLAKEKLSEQNQG